MKGCFLSVTGGVVRRFEQYLRLVSNRGLHVSLVKGLHEINELSGVTEESFCLLVQR